MPSTVSLTMGVPETVAVKATLTGTVAPAVATVPPGVVTVGPVIVIGPMVACAVDAIARNMAPASNRRP